MARTEQCRSCMITIVVGLWRLHCKYYKNILHSSVLAQSSIGCHLVGCQYATRILSNCSSYLIWYLTRICLLFLDKYKRYKSDCGKRSQDLRAHGFVSIVKLCVEKKDEIWWSDQSPRPPEIIHDAILPKLACLI